MCKELNICFRVFNYTRKIYFHFKMKYLGELFYLYLAVKIYLTQFKIKKKHYFISN